MRKILISLGMLFFSGIASATMVLPLSLKGLVQQTGNNGTIAYARMISMEEIFDDNGYPATVYQFKILDCVKNCPDGESLQVKMFGNSKKNTMQLKGFPRLTELGSEGLFFFYAPSKIGFQQFVGLGQGKFLASGPSGQKTLRNAFGNKGLVSDLQSNQKMMSNQGVSKSLSVLQKNQGAAPKEDLIRVTKALVEDVYGIH